tara:strand:- start:17774 stop:19567 length:1794 start_codon:yes stop_codon:yes gene_type:complete
MDDFEKELKIGFLAEAKQATADAEQCFLDLESNPDDAETMNKIFRLAHNLKGSSKAVGFIELGDFTHEFESFILKVKNGELKASAKVINILLQGNDHIIKTLDLLTENLDARIEPIGLVQEMKMYTEEPEVEEPVVQEHVSKTKETIESKDLENPLPDLDFDQSRFQETQPETLEVATQETKLLDTVLDVVPEKKTRAASAGTDETLRVSLQKVESLINFVGEMVILQSGLKEQAQLSNSTALKRIVQHLNKVSKEIQETSMSLRMVPIKPVFQKMQRIVRDTSLSLNKDVSFRLIGEDTDIDKTILEKISDPLVHLIRNSVDHGIESAEIRKERKKSETGSVVLKAFHQSGKLVIEVIDDGGGLDPEKLRKKAIEKKIISSDVKLSETETFNLIFAPGFSTKELVTDVSGRGVGMDVVKTNIHELGGEVQIESKLHLGSTFRIILPLTLAIVDAMILAYGDEKFVVPVNQVFETVKPEKGNLRSTTLGNILLLRSENLPLFKLGDFLSIKNSSSIENMIAIVIRAGGKPFAFLVDDILGQSQVVVKQLGPELQGIAGISGSTILGDGKPALIIEAPDLLKRTRSGNTKNFQERIQK